MCLLRAVVSPTVPQRMLQKLQAKVPHCIVVLPGIGKHEAVMWSIRLILDLFEILKGLLADVVICARIESRLEGVVDVI